MTDAGPADRGCTTDHCITCSDEGLPMRVLRLDAERGLALCVADDAREVWVETALVTPVAPDDELLVHADVALARLES